MESFVSQTVATLWVELDFMIKKNIHMKKNIP